MISDALFIKPYSLFYSFHAPASLPLTLILKEFQCLSHVNALKDSQGRKGNAWRLLLFEFDAQHLHLSSACHLHLFNTYAICVASLPVIDIYSLPMPSTSIQHLSSTLILDAIHIYSYVCIYSRTYMTRVAVGFGSLGVNCGNGGCSAIHVQAPKSVATQRNL